MSRTFVLYNVSAGWTAEPDAAERIQKIFLDHGHNCTLRTFPAGVDLTALTAELVREGAERIVAAGGDGTLRAVAQALAGTGIPMGVLPVGTLNHFARDLEIPLELDQAAAVAASGVETAVDAAQVNGQLFLNNCVLGLYPWYRLERDMKEARGAGKWRSILSSWFRILWRYPHLNLRFRADGLEVVRRTPYVLIANNEHAMEGWKPWQRERLTEGELWIYVLRDRNRFALLRVLLRILAGRRLKQEEFDVLRSAEVSVEPQRLHVNISLDGEMARIPAPLRFESKPRSLRVLVPGGSKRISENLCEIGGGAPSGS